KATSSAWCAPEKAACSSCDTARPFRSSGVARKPQERVVDCTHNLRGFVHDLFEGKTVQQPSRVDDRARPSIIGGALSTGRMGAMAVEFEANEKLRVGSIEIDDTSAGNDEPVLQRGSRKVRIFEKPKKAPFQEGLRRLLDATRENSSHYPGAATALLPN